MWNNELRHSSPLAPNPSDSYKISFCWLKKNYFLNKFTFWISFKSIFSHASPHLFCLSYFSRLLTDLLFPALGKAVHTNLFFFLLRTLLRFPIIKALLGNPTHTREWKGRKSVLSEEHLHKKYNLYKSIKMGPLPPDNTDIQDKVHFYFIGGKKDHKYVKRSDFIPN